MALLKKGPKGGLASNTLRLERELRVRLRRAELPFLAAVRGFPWEQIRGKRDERMLLEGLWMLGRENETKEPLLAIRAFERILLLAANGARARKVRAGHLTTAYAAAGRLEEARKRIEALALASRGEEQRLLWVEAADLWTAMGKAKEARKALRIASEKRLLPKAKKGLAGKKAQVDRVAEDFETASERVRRLVQARLRIQAKQKLGIESDDWIGSYPHASPKGQPVLFVFLATWSEASLRTLRYLASKLEKERAEGRSVGFDIVGVLVRGTRGALATEGRRTVPPPERSARGNALRCSRDRVSRAPRAAHPLRHREQGYAQSLRDRDPAQRCSRRQERASALLSKQRQWGPRLACGNGGESTLSLAPVPKWQLCRGDRSVLRV